MAERGGPERLTTGQLARRAGVTVRTVRWYSDRGLIVPVHRSSSGYRYYDTGAVIRLELVRTLRDIGVGLDTIARILSRDVPLAEVAAAHAKALEAKIRTLRLHHATLLALAADGTWTGQPGSVPDPDFEAALRAAVPALPAEPSATQVDAWIELKGLIADPAFRGEVHTVGEELARWSTPQLSAHAALERTVAAALPQAAAALDAKVDPAGAKAAAVVDSIVSAVAALDGASDSPDYRTSLARRLEAVTRIRVERYWQLLAVLEGSTRPDTRVPPLAWLAAALRAHPSGPTPSFEEEMM